MSRGERRGSAGLNESGGEWIVPCCECDVCVPWAWCLDLCGVCARECSAVSAVCVCRPVPCGWGVKPFGC